MKTWYAKSGSMGQGLIIEEETGRNVAVAYDESDADLLAAAPELLVQSKKMLEGVREIMRLCQQHDPATGYYKHPSSYEILKIVHARVFTIEAPGAIRKAEGEE